jgi:CBS domain-containing protein
MTTAREIMSPGVEYLKTTETAADAASRLASTGVGAVPVCESDGHLAGMVTDRDIVIKVVAAGKDPKATPLGDLADQEEVVTIGADDSVEEAAETMKRHQVRRLPVIDGEDVVGLVSQADLARALQPEQVGDLLAAISS